MPAGLAISAWDFNTNSLLTPLPYSSCYYTVRLNDAGDFQIIVDLANANTLGPMSVIQGLGFAPFKVLFTSGGQIQNAGIVYRYQMQSAGDADMTLKLSGAGLTSAFGEMIAPNSYTTSVSPAQLIANVINDVQANRGQNLFITPTLSLSNPPAPITPKYSATQKVTVAQIIADMTAAVVPGIGGIDWWFAHSYSNTSRPVHRMMINAPRAGRDRNTSGWSIDLTKAVSWRWQVDNQKLGNQAIVVGAGSGGAQPQATVTSGLPYGGLGQLPLFQQVYQFSQLSVQAQLQNIANGLVSVFGRPPAAPVVTVPVDCPTLPLGGVAIGDDVLLKSPSNQWFPNGLYQWWRVVAYKADYPAEGVPTVQYTFNTPPVY